MSVNQSSLKLLGAIYQTSPTSKESAEGLLESLVEHAKEDRAPADQLEGLERGLVVLQASPTMEAFRLGLEALKREQ